MRVFRSDTCKEPWSLPIAQHEMLMRMVHYDDVGTIMKFYTATELFSHKIKNATKWILALVSIALEADGCFDWLLTFNTTYSGIVSISRLFIRLRWVIGSLFFTILLIYCSLPMPAPILAHFFWLCTVQLLHLRWVVGQIRALISPAYKCDLTFVTKLPTSDLSYLGT